MASNRSPIVALIMGIIPFVNLYLIYQWWGELKAAKKSDKDPVIWTLLMIIPFVNLYAIYLLMTDVDNAAKAAKKEGYPLGVVPLIVILFVASMFLFGLPFLFLPYKTQEIMNACGI